MAEPARADGRPKDEQSEEVEALLQAAQPAGLGVAGGEVVHLVGLGDRENAVGDRHGKCGREQPARPPAPLPPRRRPPCPP